MSDYESAGFLDQELPGGWRLIQAGAAESIGSLQLSSLSSQSLDADEEVQIFAVDPFSWSAILSYAIKMASAQLTSAVISSFIDALFGKKVKLEDIVRDLLTQVAALLTQKMRAEALREAKANTLALQSGMRTYSLQSVPDVALLANLTTESAKVVQQLKSLGLVGVSAYSVAAACEVIVLLERHSAFKDSGMWINAKMHIDDMERHLVDMDIELRSDTPQRFSQISNRWEYDEVGPPGYTKTIDVAIYFYKLDGRVVAEFSTRRDAEVARERHMKQLISDLRRQIVIPAMAISSDLRKTTMGDPPLVVQVPDSG